MSPDGPVRSFKREYLDSQVLITTNGVFGVAATARRTFALTGTVADRRFLPVEGATVTFTSISGLNLPAPPGGDVRVTTKTGYDGAFAVINVPAGKSGTCYRMTIDAPEIGRYESVDVIDPGVYDQSIQLEGGLQIEEPLSSAGGTSHMDRACARTSAASH